MHRCTTLMCHCEEANGRRGNLAGHGWMTRYLRRNRNCLPEIATTPAGSRNDKSGSLTPMNLCLKYASLQGAQGTPLQTQSVCTFLSSICTNCECLPKIAPQGHFLALRAQGATSGFRPPRNDRPLVFPVLLTACFLHQCSAGPGCPRPLQRAAGSPILSHFQHALYALNLHFSPG